MASPRSIVLVLAVLLGSAEVARAQYAYMTPMGVAPAQPEHTPHKLERNPLIGTSIQLGAYDYNGGPDGSGTAFVQDGWIGYGLSDRLALLFWGALQIAGNDHFTEVHLAGGGVRGWPIADVPALSLEGRAGVAFQQWMFFGSDQRQADVYGSGLDLAGALIVDLIQRPSLGIEARGTVSTIISDGQHDLTLTAGLGVSFY